jgi:hypothetical protein
MAKVKSNLVVHGLSGMIGKQVVIRKTKSGGYIVAAAPHRSSTNLSEAQKAHHERFRQAIAYARTAKDLPEYKAAADARGMTSQNVATADFLRAPEITNIDVSNYHGDIGQQILITATDDVKVKSVGVLIAAEDGTFIEKGAAVVSPSDGSRWTYTATVKAPATAVKIIVDAADLADQVTEETETVAAAIA